MANLRDIIGHAQAVQTANGNIPYNSSTVKADEILDRFHDSRPINQQHVEQLAESIKVIGLIEPLVLDSKKRLLAGAHRLAAIRLIQLDDGEAFEKHFADLRIPARIFPFDAEQNPKLALEIEVAENDHRKNYTREEIKAVAEEFKRAGYRATVGRPKEGEKSLGPALAVALGRSLRTVERYLAEEKEEIPTGGGISKSATSSTDLAKALKLLHRWEANCNAPSTEEEALLKKLPGFIRAVEKVVGS
jgi:ParB family transcriptional regulator, chromosome partitioning protein